MNNEFESKNDVHPNLSEPPKKSRSWLWFGGCGCLVVLLLCGGGIAALAVPAMGVFQAISEAQSMAQESAEVQAAIGSPVEFGPPAQSQDGQTITYEFPMTGPDGSATLTMKMQVSFSASENQEVVVELEDGTKIDLLNSEEFNLDIEEPEISDEE